MSGESELPPSTTDAAKQVAQSREGLDDGAAAADRHPARPPAEAPAPPEWYDVDDGVEAAADQHFDVGVNFGDSTEHLPSTSLRLDIANPHLQMPLALLTAADEGRIQSDRDRRPQSPA